MNLQKFRIEQQARRFEMPPWMLDELLAANKRVRVPEQDLRRSRESWGGIARCKVVRTYDCVPKGHPEFWGQTASS